MAKPKRPRRFWTKADVARLRKLYPNRSNGEIAKLFGRTLESINGMGHTYGLKKSPEFLRDHCRLQKGTSIGAEFRYPKGHAPANAGKRRPGWFAGRMRETQFKKGAINGFAAVNLKPIGTILKDADGYLRIKVRDRQPDDAPGWNKNIWPALHHQVWTEHHGPIPPKHIVVFKDRDRANCKIENLEMITMAENARRNNMWRRFPRELAEVIQLSGVLKRKIRSANGKKQDYGPAGPSVRDDRVAEGSGHADGSRSCAGDQQGR